MRTAQEIEAARNKVCEEIAKGGLSHDQLIYLQATSVALCWAAGIDNTLSQLMAGQPIERSPTRVV